MKSSRANKNLSVALLYTALVASIVGCGNKEVADLDGENQSGAVGDADLQAPAGESQSGSVDSAVDPESSFVSRYVVLEGPGAIASLEGVDPASPEGKERMAARVAELKEQHAGVLASLEGLGATIVADVILVSNTIQIRVAEDRLPEIEKIPGVLRLEVPTQVNPNLGEAVPLTGTPAVWETLPTGLHGEGMRIGIIDTGIDYLHADLGGSGDPVDYTADDHDIVEASSFPTARVVGGLDLAGDAYDSSGLHGDTTPVPDDDPIDCHGHGTHVAGIAAGTGVLTGGAAYAGTYDASLDPAGFDIYPGAAPAAELYAIKVFGCEGSTDLILAAIEYATDPDGDLDVSDRLDVINLSLGSDFTDGTDVEGDAVTAFTTAGGLMVASAGNGGGQTRAHFAAGYPGSLPEVVSVGATLDNVEAYSYLSLDVTDPSSVSGVYPLGETGDHEPNISTVSSLSGQVVATDPIEACDPLTNAADLDGKIAIVERGTCVFNVKAQNAADAGAIGLLIVNNTFSDFPMDPFNGGGGHVIPMFFLRRGDGLELLAAAPFTASMTEGVETTVTVGPDYPSSFTSRGPTADVMRLKPDIAAPGSSILSAIVGTGTEGGDMSGTSMASPLTAGVAALLRQGRPTLGPLDIKKIITSTGAPVINGTDQPFLASLIGGGRISPVDALAAEVVAHVDGASGEVGVSFGAILAAEEVTETRDIIVTNMGASEVTLDVSLVSSIEWAGTTLEVSPATISVPAGGTATVELSLTVDPSALPESPAYNFFTTPISTPTLSEESDGFPSIYLTEVSGMVMFTPASATESIAGVAYHGVVRAVADRNVGEVTGCLSNDGEGTATLTLEGDPAPLDNATSVLELGTLNSTLDDPTGPQAFWDITAVGSLYDPETERIFLGVATAGDWVTPSKGWLSDVAFEIDTDGDDTADLMVTVESFSQPDPEDNNVSNNSAPYARVVNLATGDLSQSYQPINSIFPAYPGGMFFAGDPPDTYETHVYFNNVLVFPVRISDLGMDASDATFAYRGVSAMSRFPLMVGLPMDEPVDTTDWVDFDATTPKVALPDCFYGTSMCTGDSDEIAVEIPADADPLPTLLVFHHSNGDAASWETIDLAGADLEWSDLAISSESIGELAPGESAAAMFTITNDSGTDREGVLVSFAAEGGTIDSLTSAAGTCDSSTCDLGVFESGASDEISVEMTAGSEGTLTVTATVTSTSECEADTDNNQAVAEFQIAAQDDPEADAGTEDSGSGSSGCGCHTVASNGFGGGWMLTVLAVGLAILGRRLLR